MRYQVLVSAVDAEPLTLAEKMNLQSDAVLVNQCGRSGDETVVHGGHDVRVVSMTDRGVGLSRNGALARAGAEIISFADEDMTFLEGAPEAVLREFDAHPKADLILFSLASNNSQRPLLTIPRFSRVGRRAALKYGCARLAARREKLLYANVSFSLLFGGGTRYLSGEDTLFLQDCMRAGLTIYRSPVKIADVDQGQSSWFHGYTDRYYRDKGALLAAALPRLSVPYALLTAVKAGRGGVRETVRVFSLLLAGIKEYRSMGGLRETWSTN